MRNADLYDDHQMCPIALTKLLSHPQLSMNSLIPLEELVVSTNIFYRLFSNEILCTAHATFYSLKFTSLYIRYWSIAQTVGTCGFSN